MRVLVFDEPDVHPIAGLVAAIPQLAVFEGAVLEDSLRHTSVHLIVAFSSVHDTPGPGTGHSSLTEIIIQTVAGSAWSEAEHRFRYDARAPNTDRARTAKLADIERIESVVNRFDAVLGRSDVHEKRDVHPIIAEHPFLIHPNPDQVWSEVAIGLGTEYRIDFVIREPDGGYVLVEIENPNHRLFTAGGDFTAIVNHAIRQVEDWQQWIEENIATVQRALPGIVAPSGLVIVGRSRDLSSQERGRLVGC